MTSPNNCLTDEELTRLVQGRELSDEREMMMLHLDRCPGCRMVLAEAAQHLSILAAVRRPSWPRTVAVVAAALVVLIALWLLATSGGR